jgi:hypothetical protein
MGSVSPKLNELIICPVKNKKKLIFFSLENELYNQTCVQRPPLGPENCGRYTEG